MAGPPQRAQNSFGSCWSVVSDLTMPSVMVTGNRVIAEAIARRWGTPRGGLIDDPNYGFDLSDYVGDDIDPNGLGRIAAFAAAEATKDERVISCNVTLTLDTAGKMTVNALVRTATGPFQLVLSVDQVTVSLLSVSNQ